MVLANLHSSPMPALKSSCLAYAEYEFGVLYLTFRSGRTYTLRGVPKHHYLGLLAASSAGQYFNRHLKGRY